MKDALEKVADRIFERGALKFGAFKLKLHEIFPDAPLSPFYLSLRTPRNKGGTLMPEDFDLIARALIELIEEKGLIFEAMAPIPRAGDPIVQAIERIAPNKKFRIVLLEKEELENKRCIVPIEGFDYKKGEMILLIDDLVTKAGTKIEACRAIESEGSVVKDLVVLVDREQGGREEIENAGYNLHAAFTMSELLDYYKETGRITEEKYSECVNYMKTV